MNEFPCQPPVETETGWTVEAALTGESEYLRGHFPGRPILPAVAQLALLTQVVRESWGREVSICSIRDLRFRMPLVPEAQIEVRVGADKGDAESRFGIFCAGKPVSQGIVSWSSEEVAVTSDYDRFQGSPPSGPLILLPQEDEARYVHECVSSDESGLDCLARIPDGNPFRTEGQHGTEIPAFLALELGAQAAAAHEGVMRAASGAEATAVGGYVVRCRQAVFHRTALPADAVFRVRATCDEAAPPLRTYKISVGLDQTALVEGFVSTFASE